MEKRRHLAADAIEFAACEKSFWSLLPEAVRWQNESKETAVFPGPFKLVELFIPSDRIAEWFEIIEQSPTLFRNLFFSPFNAET